MNPKDFLTDRAERYGQGIAARYLSNQEKILSQGDDTEATEDILTPKSTAVERAGVSGHYTRTVKADQLNIAIEYRDSSGIATVRAVTILEIKSSKQGPVMEAFCHERNAARTFRIDRISHIITSDGEVFDPAAFFRDIIGIDLLLFARFESETETTPFHHATMVRSALRPMISLLALAARSDGHFHRNELDVIEIYVERELVHMEKNGQCPAPLSISMLEHLSRMIQELRPRPNVIEEYLTRIEQMNDAAIRRFWRAMFQVMHADGEFTDEEADFLSYVEGFRTQ